MLGRWYCFTASVQGKAEVLCSGSTPHAPAQAVPILSLQRHSGTGIQETAQGAGGGGWWDELGDWDGHVRTDVYKMDD